MNPENSSVLLWLAVADPGIAAPDLKAKAAQVHLESWPGPILRMFLGELSPEELLARAKDAVSWRARQQECEAYFFIGQFHKQRGDMEAAANAFRRAIDTDVRRYEEYDSARLELRRLASAATAATAR